MSIWSKIYSKINWKDEPIEETPLSARNLNKIDSALDEIDKRVVEVNNRVETLVTAEQSGDEVTDIRVGYDGSIYPSAGSSVRSQVSQLSESIVENYSELKSDLDEQKYLSREMLTVDDYLTIEGKYIDYNGNLNDNTNYISSDFIKVKKGDMLHYKLRGSDTSYVLLCSYYSDKGLYGRVAYGGGMETDVEGTWETPIDGYVRISNSVYFDDAVFEINDSGNLIGIKKIINKSVTKLNIEHGSFNYGYAETQNGYYSINSSEFTHDLSYVSKKMEVTEGDICIVSCSTPKAVGFAMCIFFNENMNVIGYVNLNKDTNGNQYVDEIVEVPKNAKYITTTGRASFECKLGKLSYGQTNNTLIGKTIVNFGDSIFGNDNSITDISSLLAKETYANVINCTFGGTKMVVRDSINGYDKFDFENLVNAIVSGDFTNQDNAILNYSLPSYYPDRLQILRYVDFSKVDIVTLNFSTNDYTFGVTKARLKQVYIDTLSKLQTAYPNLIVVIISPTWRCWLNDDGTFKEDSNTKIWYSFGDSTLVDYCNILQETAKELNIQYIDVYNIGINKNTWNHYFTIDDTTHQNLNGRKRISDVISKQLI